MNQHNAVIPVTLGKMKEPPTEDSLLSQRDEKNCIHNSKQIQFTNNTYDCTQQYLPTNNSVQACDVSNNLYAPDLRELLPKYAFKMEIPSTLIHWINRQFQEASSRHFNCNKINTLKKQLKSIIRINYSENNQFKVNWDLQDYAPIVFESVNIHKPQQNYEMAGVIGKQFKTKASKNKSNLASTSNLRSKYPSKSFNVDLNNCQDFTLSTKFITDYCNNDSDRKKRRLERFASDSKPKKKWDDDEDYSDLNATSNHSYKFDKNKPVIGRCCILEKKYLRLTSNPNPENIRPLSVLEKAYDLILYKYSNEGATYQYLCDQFKSMRQDLKVQIIENNFTVKVYLTHAKIALENGDLGEYNQCQSSLKDLFELPTISKANFGEFMSYCILYYLMTEDHSSINQLRLKLLTKELEEFSMDPMIQLALNISLAQAQGNYHCFFKLYAQTKGPMKCLIKQYIKRERLSALNLMCKSYNQLKLTFLVPELNFEKDDDPFAFFQELGLIPFIVPTNNIDNMYLDTKKCRFNIAQHYTKSKKVDIKGQI